jgi:putative Ca2+/H+ antiporter (TMEM165/GDT1 family)
MDALPFISTFLLILVAELGDKTRLITITVAAETSRILVLLGMTRAFALLSSVAVRVGAKLLSRLPPKIVKDRHIGTLQIIGVLTIPSALLRISIILQLHHFNK